MVSDVLEIDEAELPERVPVEEAAHSERGEVSECLWWYQSGRGILSQAARLVRVVCLYTGEEVVLLGCSEKEGNWDWKLKNWKWSSSLAMSSSSRVPGATSTEVLPFASPFPRLHLLLYHMQITRDP